MISIAIAQTPTMVHTLLIAIEVGPIVDPDVLER